jgi:uncharacterized membrane protein HdeD (DUF308 family)
MVGRSLALASLPNRGRKTGGTDLARSPAKRASSIVVIVAGANKGRGGCHMLSKLMSRYWWVLLLRGTVAILFGIAALAYPGMALGSLVIYFAVFALVDGISSVFHAFFGRKDNESWWVLLLEGLLGIAFGVITLQVPGITTLMLLLYIGFWAMATGVLRIILAVRLRHEMTGEWWMVLGGLASILFGLAMVARPGAGALALLTIIGVWSLVAGFSLVFFSFKVRSVGGKLGALKARPATA